MRTFTKGLLALLIGVASLLTQVNAQAKPLSSGLNLSRVVLYTSGLAYYEHSAMVDGNATIRLQFKVEQINDVLKTLIVRDYGGGSIQSVSYAAQDPLERSLQSFAINLSARPGLVQILTQVTGHELTIQLAKPLSGRLVGIETRQIPGTDGQMLDEIFLNLYTGKSLQSIALRSIQSIQMNDERLNREFQAALDVLKSNTDARQRTVEINCQGSGKREIRFAYIQEAPVWKTTYRLDLGGAVPYLQAWALVENTSDSDWSQVNLSLASGQPIAFIQDLYTPVYQQRPVIGLSQVATVQAQTYSSGMVMNKPGASPAPAPATTSSMGIRGQSYTEDQDKAKLEVEEDDFALRSSAVSAATVQREGELFFYNIKDKVSLARRQSAMIPLLAAEAPGQRLSIYNQSSNARRPLYGASIKSPVGTRFPAGPVSVFDGTLYAGDALVDGLADNEAKLLSYGVDLDILVDASESITRTLRTYSLSKGLLIIQNSRRHEKTYTIKNSSAANKNLMIEHPIVQGRSLLSPTQYQEKTGQYYRFQQSIDPASTSSFVVAEESLVSESIRLTNINSSTFGIYQNEQGISPAIKAALAKAAELKATWDSLNQKLNATISTRSTSVADQSRTRDNIASVGRDSSQGKVYIQKLADLENRIEGIDKEAEQLRSQIEAARQGFENYINKLEIQ